MIVAAALCPAPPLLIRELTGIDEVVPELRLACLAAAAELAASAPDVIVVVGAAQQTRTWAEYTLDLSEFAPGVRSAAGTVAEATLLAGMAGGPGFAPELPPSVGIGAWLLTEAGYAGDRILSSVGHDESAVRCADVGAELPGLRERVALLVMADGSARRTLKAPGYLDERSAGFDASVELAIREGELDALLSIDAVLARVLMATGRPAWQVLAGALRGRRVTSVVRYCDAPFGVAYLVASLRMGLAEDSLYMGHAEERRPGWLS